MFVRKMVYENRELKSMLQNFLKMERKKHDLLILSNTNKESH